MSKEELCKHSACELKEKIDRQEITSVELTEVVIKRIERINPIINAYCTPTFDLARKMASEADDRVKKSDKLPPLNGLPTSIKDLMLTKGIRTTYGSIIHENLVPEEDEIAVQRLLDAGTIMLGKTNTPPFGYVGVTDNQIFGATKNPWHLERTPGGSSGGAAAASAAAMSPLALGSDGGGSIRHPACFCGVFGFKPTFGRVPRYPVNGYAGNHITHYGPIVRYVEDGAMMLDAMKGHDMMDCYSLPDDGISYLEKLDDRPTKLKIGWTVNLGWTKAINEEVEKCIAEKVLVFEKLGWTVEPVKIKIRNPEAAFYAMWTAKFTFDHKRHIREFGERLDPQFRRMAGGSFSPTNDHLKALKKRRQFFEKMMLAYKKHEIDILVTPTTAVPAFELGQSFPPVINGKSVSPTGWQPYTFPFNMTHQPAATLPSGFSKDGLPIGMQVIGLKYQDLLVLQVSKAFQDLSPWQEKLPEL